MLFLILNSPILSTENREMTKIQFDVLRREKKFSRDFFHINAVVPIWMQKLLMLVSVVFTLMEVEGIISGMSVVLSLFSLRTLFRESLDTSNWSCCPHWGVLSLKICNVHNNLYVVNINCWYREVVFERKRAPEEIWMGEHSAASFYGEPAESFKASSSAVFIQYLWYFPFSFPIHP